MHVLLWFTPDIASNASVTLWDPSVFCMSLTKFILSQGSSQAYKLYHSHSITHREQALSIIPDLCLRFTAYQKTNILADALLRTWGAQGGGCLMETTEEFIHKHKDDHARQQLERELQDSNANTERANGVSSEWGQLDYLRKHAKGA